MNTQSPKSLYPWTRYWLPFQTTYSLDYHGFPSFRVFSPEGEKMLAVTLQDLETIPCLVLLGEPGMGKSTEVGEAPKPENCLSFIYPLNRASNERNLFDTLERKQHFKEWLKADQSLYLYLDGLDEALLSINTFSGALIEWLEDNRETFKIPKKASSENAIEDKHSLYLRITCRSAIWSEETGRALGEIFGEANVRIIELAPLRQDDIRLVARYTTVHLGLGVETWRGLALC